jgi:hypothetical protein
MQPQAVQIYGVGEAVETIEALAHLPSYRYARIPPAKIEDYMLSTEQGDGKAYRFRNEFGIERRHAGYLREQIVEGLTEAPAIFHRESKQGIHWEVPVLVTGHNAHVGYVTTGWIIRPGDPRPHLVTGRVSESALIPRQRAAREAFGYSTGANGDGHEGRGAVRIVRRVSPGHEGDDLPRVR